jgi:CheY-like chemotaxis protein
VEAGWEFLRQSRPALVLLDVNLSGHSGLELCRRARTVAELASVTIALFTQWGIPRDLAAGLEAGVDFVFCKDLVCRPRDWQRRLQEILSAGSGQPCPWSLGCLGGEEGPRADWLSAVTQSLHHASVRWLGSEVLRAVLGRALRQTFAADCAHAGATSWLLPEGIAFDPACAPTTLPPAMLFALLTALSEQFWRLLGAEASAPVRAVLAALPGAPTTSSLP